MSSYISTTLFSIHEQLHQLENQLDELLVPARRQFERIAEWDYSFCLNPPEFVELRIDEIQQIVIEMNNLYRQYNEVNSNARGSGISTQPHPLSTTRRFEFPIDRWVQRFHIQHTDLKRLETAFSEFTIGGTVSFGAIFDHEINKFDRLIGNVIPSDAQNHFATIDELIDASGRVTLLQITATDDDGRYACLQLNSVIAKKPPERVVENMFNVDVITHGPSHRRLALTNAIKAILKESMLGRGPRLWWSSRIGQFVLRRVSDM